MKRRPAETREEMLAAIAEAQRLDWDGEYLEGEDDLAEAAEEAEEYLADQAACWVALRRASPGSTGARQ